MCSTIAGRDPVWPQNRRAAILYRRQHGIAGPPYFQPEALPWSQIPAVSRATMRGRAHAEMPQERWGGRSEREGRNHFTALEFRADGALARRSHQNPDGSRWTAIYHYDAAGQRQCATTMRAGSPIFDSTSTTPSAVCFGSQSALRTAANGSPRDTNTTPPAAKRRRRPRIPWPGARAPTTFGMLTASKMSAGQELAFDTTMMRANWILKTVESCGPQTANFTYRPQSGARLPILSRGDMIRQIVNQFGIRRRNKREISGRSRRPDLKPDEVNIEAQDYFLAFNGTCGHPRDP